MAADAIARLRNAAVIVLIGLAVSWPLSNLGPQDPVLVTLTPDHGIDAYDLLSLIPLAAAVTLLVVSRRTPRRHRRVVQQGDRR